LSNILNNAYESINLEKKEIIIKIDVIERRVVLSVEDNGTGMSKDYLKKVLKGGTSSKINGHGIGLQFSYLSLLKMNFTVDIDSRVGTGTKFIISKETSKINKSSINDIRQIVFIDDDKLIRTFWEQRASEVGVRLSSYESVVDFIKNSSQFDKDTVIYIDSTLDHEVLGEVESKKIFDKGFTNLYLATGKQASEIEKPFWIKEIVGKRPSF
jgi:hypothetical protein